MAENTDDKQPAKGVPATLTTPFDIAQRVRRKRTSHVQPGAAVVKLQELLKDSENQ